MWANLVTQEQINLFIIPPPPRPRPGGIKAKSAFRRILFIHPAIGAPLLSGVANIGTERHDAPRFSGDTFGFQDVAERLQKLRGATESA